MDYTTFGRRTGLRVSQYALGTANFGTAWGAGADRVEAKAILDGFVEAGGNFLDSADTYQVGESEQLLGEFTRAHRDDLVIGTKYAIGADPSQPLSRTGNAVKNLRLSVEASLKRLGTDIIDVLWVHYPDALTPVDEILRGLDDLVRQGKIHYAAFSNFPAWRTSRAAAMADLRGWSPIVGIQTEYSLVERTADRELLPMAEALGLATTLWSPLGGGLLTGKYRRSTDGRLTDLGGVIHTESTPQKTAVVDAVIEIAEEAGRPPAQVATAWVNERASRASTPTIPVIGPRNVAQLEDYLGALSLTLSAEQYTRLSDVSAPELGVPHDGNLANLPRVQGGAPSRIVPPRVPVA